MSVSGGVSAVHLLENVGVEVKNSTPIPVTISGGGGGPQDVNVLNFPAIQPVSQSGTWSVGRTWSLVNTLDSVNIGNFPATQAVSGSVSVSNFPATQPISDSTDIEYTSVATTVTNVGDTTIYTPAAGKRVRLHWIYAINDPVAANSTKITVKIGAQTYYVAWAISKRQQFTGPVNGALVVNLSALGQVAVTAFVEEV